MSSFNPEGGPPSSENFEEFTGDKLQSLLSDAKIAKSIQITILKDFESASPGQKQWLKKRLETIVGTAGTIQKDYKKTLGPDWEARKMVY